MKRNIIAYLAIVFVAIAPLLVTTISFSMAHVLGCAVDEASNHPCIIFGLDWGSVIYFLVVFGWFSIVTVPISAIALVGLTIFLAVKKIRNHAAQS